MAYTAFDPRKAIREKIGTTWWDEEKKDQWTINITDANNATVRIPMYLSEEVKTETLAEMPYLEMNMAYTTYDPHDVGATTRQMKSYIDIRLEFANTDNIDATDFGKDVCDQIINLIRTNQCDFTGIDFINVEEIRHLREERAHQVVSNNR